MSKIVVLGAGLVGSVIAIDLSKNHDVTSADLNPESFSKFNAYTNIKTVSADLSNPDSMSFSIEISNGFPAKAEKH